MYGHNIDIQLKNKGQIIRLLTFGLTNADDKLFAIEYLDNNTEANKRTTKDISKQESMFTRAVSVHSSNLYPSNAKHGYLIDHDENLKDKKITQVPNVQKCKFAVYIDPLWETLVGNELEIYPIVYSPKIPNSEKEFSTNTLKVNNSGTLLKVEKIDSNQVALISQTETNMAYFHHCNYSAIKLSEKDKEKITVFDLSNIRLRDKNPIEVDVIAGKKSSYFLDIDLHTEECEIKPKPHFNNEITIKQIPPDYEILYDSGVNVQNSVKPKETKLVKTSSSVKTTNTGVSSTSKEDIKNETKTFVVRRGQVQFDAFYNYDIPPTGTADPVLTYAKALQYIRLDNTANKVEKINMQVSSCALDRNVNLTFYPDIKWTIKLGFNVTKNDIEAINKKGLKTPLKVFESLEDEKSKLQEKVKEKDKEFFDKNKDLKRIKNAQINETRKAFKLKKKPKKSNKDITPSSGGKIAGLIEILKRLNFSLAEEHYGGTQKNELNEEFLKKLYSIYSGENNPFDLLLQVAEIVEGSKDPAEDKIENLLASKGKSVAGLRAKMNRKPVDYTILYPKIALAASWFYEMVDPKKYPDLAGRQGLGLDLNLSAKPLIGITVKWDLLELLCRRHPVAYAVLKALDAIIYIIGDDESAVEFNFSVTGQIETEINWQHNMLAGFKDMNAKGKSALNVKLDLKINIAQTYKVLNYEVIVKRGFSVGASSGIGVTDVYGIDNEGLYLQKILEFEGIKFEFSATGIMEVKKTELDKKKKNIVSLGGEIKGEITFLNYKYESPKIHLIS
ncbi:hypothetical protein [Empedobacter falsenii]|uniref:Uncharacterized protein n=1 Tax=Empedobacter falsenii TaxID=343874 RepID=A0AAW7DHZ5_9FLAO|nr:hypothetical protein [Empedobacter falsenii]MDM1551091.1 hypothetical protein [Empedobacter falsenii]